MKEKNNKNKLLVFLVFIFLFIVNINTTKAATTTISSIQDLYNMRNVINGNYELGIDLDFNNDDSYDETLIDGYASVSEFKTAMTTGTGWLPIGVLANQFTGMFDGKGYTISNLYINRPSSRQNGLFGVVNDPAELINISLENVNITGLQETAGLVGDDRGSNIRNSYVTGIVSGTNSTGGLVGSKDDGMIIDSYTNGAVSGVSMVGGLAGTNYGSTIKSYSTANVTGNDWAVGGLVGDSEGLLENSYSTGDVVGTSMSVGGLVGYFWGTMSNSYSTGSVTGTSQDIGGLVGYSDGQINSSYYNTTTSGQSDNTGKGSPRTTAEMTYPYDETSTTTYVGWDFNNIWHNDTAGTVNGGYPYNYNIPDTTPPVITILGDNPKSIYINDEYIDAGATASDNVDGNLTSSIISTNTVNTSVAGSYTVTYNVSDAANNPATPAIRTVSVLNRPGGGIPIYMLNIMNQQNQANQVSQANQAVSQIVVGDNQIFKYPNDSKVYLLENGLKRWIKDEESFNKLGYKWSDIKIISDNTVVYSNGIDLEVIKSVFTFTKVLKLRSVGNDVSQLQTILKKLGYFIYPRITSFFGSQTYNALIKFQKANRLKMTGIVDKATMDILNKL